MKQQKLIGTRRQLATMLNLSERRITDLVTAKIIPPRGKRGFDLVASVKGYTAFLKKPTAASLVSVPAWSKHKPIFGNLN